MERQLARSRSRARYAAVAVGVLLVGLAGYLGFVAFVDSDRDPGTGVMVLAAGTGFAAFFSPCSFPLLLTFLTGRSDESPGAAVASALRVGAGAALLLAPAAVILAVGGTSLGNALAFDSVPGRVFRFAVGALLILLGLHQAQLIGLRFRWLDRVAARAADRLDASRFSSRAAGDLAYGFGYLLAGFG